MSQAPGLTAEEARKVANLARLSCDDAAIAPYIKDLNKIMQMFEVLQNTDTSGIAPMSHPLDARQRLRADVVTEVDQREQFQSIAPLVEKGLYLVPKVIE